MTFDPPQNIGGVEGRARAYTEVLTAKGYFVELISLSSNNKFTKENFLGANLNKFPSNRIFKSFRETRKLISANRIDSVFLLSGALTIFGMLLLAYCRIAKIKTAIFLYGKDILETKGKFISRSGLFVSPMLASKVATNSHYTQCLLPRIIPKRKLIILYPGVSVKFLDKVSSLENAKQRSEKTILFVGRLVRRKGLDDLLKAFDLLSSQFDDLKLEIVGDGPDMERVQKISQGFASSPKVSFVGPLSGDPLYKKYAECDVFVMPSRTLPNDVEGFGTVFLEAGLFAKPSVGTRSGGIPDAIVDGETGILVSESNPQELSKSIAFLLKNENESKLMGKRAQERVLNDFSWEKVTFPLIRIFSDESEAESVNLLRS